MFLISLHTHHRVKRRVSFCISHRSLAFMFGGLLLSCKQAMIGCLWLPCFNTIFNLSHSSHEMKNHHRQCQGALLTFDMFVSLWFFILEVCLLGGSGGRAQDKSLKWYLNVAQCRGISIPTESQHQHLIYVPVESVETWGCINFWNIRTKILQYEFSIMGRSHVSFHP